MMKVKSNVREAMKARCLNAAADSAANQWQKKVSVMFKMIKRYLFNVFEAVELLAQVPEAPVFFAWLIALASEGSHQRSMHGPQDFAPQV